MIESQDVHEHTALVRDVLARSAAFTGFEQSWYRVWGDGQPSGVRLQEAVSAWLTHMHPSDRLVLVVADGTAVPERGTHTREHQASLTALSHEWLFGLQLLAKPGSEGANLLSFRFALPGLTLGPVEAHANAFTSPPVWPALDSVRFLTADRRPHTIGLSEHRGRTGFERVVAGDPQAAVDVLREHAMGRSWVPPAR